MNGSIRPEMDMVNECASYGEKVGRVIIGYTRARAP